MTRLTYSEFTIIRNQITSNTAPEHLDLHNREMNDEYVRLLFIALGNNDSVRTVDLSSNLITNTGARHIIYFLSPSRTPLESDLISINLDDNYIEFKPE